MKTYCPRCKCGQEYDVHPHNFRKNVKGVNCYYRGVIAKCSICNSRVETLHTKAYNKRRLNQTIDKKEREMTCDCT